MKPKTEEPPKKTPNPGRFGLYLHIPVCLAKCPYCDFLSYARDLLAYGTMDRLVEAMTRELDLALDACPELRGRPLDSVYFGGGTPSLLPGEAVATLIQSAGMAFAPRKPMEVTLECNPAAAETDRLSDYRAAGVNRISLGAQSFHPDVLQSLGRIHSAEEALAAIARIKSLGFASWSLDLIFGTPVSTPELWREDLEKAIEIAPPHLSVYGMTLHEGTPLFERMERGKIALPDEEAQRGMFLVARRMLHQAGLRHYEISNYALPGHESRHNSLYWTGGEYLGLGLSAHSCFGGLRRANPSVLQDYFAEVESGKYPAQIETLPSVGALRGERIMLALRQLRGFNPLELGAEMGCDFFREYGEEARRLADRGLLQVSPANIRLSEEGILLSDHVFEAFF